MRLRVRKVETRSQCWQNPQHQSAAKSEPGLEPGPRGAICMASSRILNLAWPRAESILGVQVTGHREGNKRGGGRAGTSRALLHRTAQPQESQRS